MPLQYTHLKGAEQITLDGVFHSVDRPNDWYGSEEVVDRWLSTVYQQVRPASARKDGNSLWERISEPFSDILSR